MSSGMKVDGGIGGWNTYVNNSWRTWGFREERHGVAGRCSSRRDLPDDSSRCRRSRRRRLLSVIKLLRKFFFTLTICNTAFLLTIGWLTLPGTICRPSSRPCLDLSRRVVTWCPSRHATSASAFDPVVAISIPPSEATRCCYWDPVSPYQVTTRHPPPSTRPRSRPSTAMVRQACSSACEGADGLWTACSCASLWYPVFPPSILSLSCSFGM